MAGAGKHKAKPDASHLGRIWARCEGRCKDPVSADTAGSKIKQVKEPGLLTLPRLGSQRTAMPTA